MRRFTALIMSLLLAFTLFTAPPAAAQDMYSAPADDVVLGLDAPAVPDGWTTVHGTYVLVHGRPEDERLLLALSRHASDSVLALSDQLDVPIGGTIHVYLASTRAEFTSLQPGRVPEYADGTAWPGRGAIFLRRPVLRGPGARPLEQVLDHELVHVLLGRTFAPGHPPRWLQEGIAQVAAGEHDPSAVQRIARGGLMGGPYTLRQLTYGFPEDAARADLAYAQSADFISFIQAEHGDDALRTLIREMNHGGDVDRAVRRATGMFMEDVEAEWLGRLGGGLPLWVTLAADLNTWWFLAAVLGFGGLILARRRLRRRMKDYAEAEARQDALVASLLGRTVLPRGVAPPGIDEYGPH